MSSLLSTRTKPRTLGPRFDGLPASAEAFESLPEDGHRYELHEGIIRVSPSPGFDHDLIVSFVHAKLYAHVQKRGLGFVFTSEYDVQLSPKRRYKPDVKFVARANRGIVRLKRIQGPPDLVVEVVSPDHPPRDWVTEFQAYQKAGVAEYWVIDAKTVSASFFVHDGERLVEQTVRGRYYSSTAVEGFRLDLTALAEHVRSSLDGIEDSEN